MSRNWELFLRDMLEAAQRVQRYSSGHSLPDFLGNEMAFDATVRNLEILGRAAKGIPDEVKARHPNIDWRGVAGLRDVLAHAYFALDDETLWTIIQKDVPHLLTQLKAIEKDLP